MKIREYLIFLFVVLFVVSMLYFYGCGTTGRSMQREEQVDDVADIDELLGLADKKVEGEVDNDTIAEDDVLRLLGVTEEAESGITQSGTEGERASLAKQIENLEKERTALQEKKSNLTDKVSQQELILSREKAAPVSKESGFSGQYQNALQDYRSHRYRDAIQKFESLLTLNAQHTLSDNCQYWIGECYYGLEKYQQAIVAFEKVFSFANSNKDDAAQLKLGLCYVRLDDRQRAKKEFQKLVDNYPTSEYVSIAKRFISQIE